MPKFGWEEVPGLIFKNDYKAIVEISQKLPNKCKLVEVGSMVGKSAVAWASSLEALNKEYDILCIDLFRSNPKETLNRIIDVFGLCVPGIESVTDDQLTNFKRFTKGYNVRVLNEDCNNVVLSEKVHCIFEDSDHTAKTLVHCLPKWWDSLLPGGILCGHDYCLPPRFHPITGKPQTADVEVCVNEFAKSIGKEVKVFEGSTFWQIIKE